jgi:hypothetical protein
VTVTVNSPVRSPGNDQLVALLSFTRRSASIEDGLLHRQIVNPLDAGQGEKAVLDDDLNGADDSAALD